MHYYSGCVFHVILCQPVDSLIFLLQLFWTCAPFWVMHASTHMLPAGLPQRCTNLKSWCQGEATAGIMECHSSFDIGSLMFAVVALLHQFYTVYILHQLDVSSYLVYRWWPASRVWNSLPSAMCNIGLWTEHLWTERENTSRRITTVAFLWYLLTF